MRKLLLQGAAIVAIALTTAGCATEYNPEMGLTGGSQVSMVTPTRAIVSFSGNGYTSSDTVQQYVLLRAAELTHERGFGHFAILNGASDNRTQSFTNAYAYGTGYGAWGTASTSTFVFPKERIEIEMYSGGKPAGAAPNVFSVAEVINTIRPTL